jgi:hypothetical protein
MLNINNFLGFKHSLDGVWPHFLYSTTNVLKLILAKTFIQVTIEMDQT